jgi:hypothetical protein
MIWVIRTTTVSITKASTSVQFCSVDTPDFQKIIDENYAEFVAQLEAGGFVIITPEEAGKTEY